VVKEIHGKIYFIKFRFYINKYYNNKKIVMINIFLLFCNILDEYNLIVSFVTVINVALSLFGNSSTPFSSL
jgi:hypothetical protein